MKHPKNKLPNGKLEPVEKVARAIGAFRCLR